MSNLVSLYQTEHSIRVEIQNQCSFISKGILLLALIASVLIPIACLILAANNGKMNFGMLIGCAVFGFLVVYPLLKNTIWQFSGQEIFIIDKNKVTYEACFKFLKHPFDEMPANCLEILFSDRELEKDERIGRLVFLNENHKLKSALKVNETAYLQLLELYKLL